MRPYKESTQSNAASKQNADDDAGEGDSQQRQRKANEIKRSKHVNQHLTSPSSSHTHSPHGENTPHHHHIAHTIQILHVNNTTYHQIQVNATRVAASNTH